jgi:hypothetical protein
MANRWDIPDWLAHEVILRDVECVYCGVTFSDHGGPRRSRPSWEHIVNDARIVTVANIALCCVGCNASKGTKDIELWLSSRHCSQRGISGHSVAPVVKEAVLRRPSVSD